MNTWSFSRAEVGARWPTARRSALAISFIFSLLLAGASSSWAAVPGAIAGKFAVSATGTATYTIPIPTPGATADMAPQLALGYSSDAGDGLVGVGWQLAGFSLITRCPRTLAQDGIMAAIAYSPDARFCLDGNRLILTSGIYGSAGATYVTELANFESVTSHTSGGAGPVPDSGPQWFTVVGPGGKTYEYGKTANSEVLAAGLGQNVVRIWALDKITDTAGNAINFQYEQSNGNLRPTRVFYTSVGGATALHNIVLNYEALPASVDHIYHNGGGATVEVNQRLSEIDITGYVNGAWTTLLSYTLAYDAPNTHRSRLHSVTECGADGTCFKPTVFDYQNGSVGLQSPSGTGWAAPNAAAYAHEMDVNGDGLEDFVYPSGDSGGGGGGGGGGGCGNPPCRQQGPIGPSTATGTWQVIFANGNGYDAPQDTGIGDVNYGAAQSLYFNRDGKADLLVADTNGHWKVLQSNGGGFQSVDTGVEDSGDLASAMAMDFNGDGLTDLVYIADDGLYLILNTGGGFAASSPVLVNTLQDLGGWGINGGLSVSIPLGVDSVADFNGDGRADLIIKAALYSDCLQEGCQRTYEGTYWTALVAAGGQQQNDGSYDCPASGPHVCRYRQYGSLLGNGEAPDDVFPLVADLNGDGLSDIVLPTGQSDVNTNGWTWHAYVATGDGFMNHGSGINYNADEYLTSLVFDWDSDGKQDVLIKRNGRFYWLRSNGVNLTAPVDTGAAVPGQIGGSFRVVDVGGAGLNGLLWASGSVSSPGYWEYQAHAGQAPDLMNHLTDGLGNWIALDYAPLDVTDAYTSGSGTNYPMTDLASSLPLITGYSANDGIGGSYSISYKYHAARVDLSGRGFLGFGEVDATDSRTGITTKSYYHQDWPYIGLIASTGTFQSGDTPIQIRSNSWGNITVQSGATEPVLWSSFYYSYGISGSFRGQLVKTTITTYSGYDSANGKPRDMGVEVTTPDGQNFTDNTTTVFDNNAATGCIGMPNQVTETRTGMNPADPTESRVVSYDNDLIHCRVNSVTQEDAEDPSLKLTQTYLYDDVGNVAKLTVTGGTLSGGARVTDYTYDYNGTYLQIITRHVGTHTLVTHQQWDKGLALQTGVTAPSGAVTTWNYDGLGRVVTKTLPTSAREVVSYDYCGGYCDVSTAAYHIKTELRNATDNIGGRTLVEVDKLGRTVAVKKISLNGPFTEVLTEYDALGNKHRLSEPSFVGDQVYWNTYTYDLLGRPTQITDGAGHETDYDYEGLQEKVTVGAGSPDQRQTTSQFDALGERTQVTDAAGHVTAYGYTPFGARQSITDSAGNVITYHHNTRGFLVGVDDPDRGTHSFTYDAVGDLLTATDADGKKITQTWDALGRMLTRSMPGARGGTAAATWTYDTATNGNGLLASVMKSEGGGDSYIETYSYNGAGQPVDITEIMQALPAVVSRSYDSFGRLASITYPDVAVLSGGSGGANTRFKVSYAYDWSGAVLKAYDANHPGTVFWQADTADARGNVSQATLGNGLIIGQTYDPAAGTLQEVKVGTPAEPGSTVWMQYQYDALNEVRERASPNDGLVQDFTYTALGQLDTQTLYQDGTQTQQMTYHYDGIGNITSRPAVGGYTYGENGAGPHAVTSIGGTLNATFSYNAAGEMTAGNGRVYGWDVLGRVSHIGEGLGATDFWYTPEGRRYREELTDSLSQMTTSIWGFDPYFRMVQTGPTTDFRNAVLVGGAVVATVTTDGTGAVLATRYLHRDGLGSVVATSDEAGTVTGRSAYGVWGRRVNPTTWKGDAPQEGTLTDTRRGYTGHEQLPEVDLIHMDGRVYDPEIGRFVSADPVLQSPYSPQDLNGYSYVMNSPMSYTDPTGYDIWGALTDPLNLLGGVTDALEGLVGDVGHAIEHLAHEVKTYWKAIVIIAAAVFTAGVAAAALMVYFAGVGATMASLTAAQALAVAVVSGAVAGGAMGAGMTLAYGGSLGNALANGLRGAAVGAVAGGLTYGAGAVSAQWGFFGRAVAHGVAGGLTGVAAGGNFQKGFELAVLAYGAFSLYQHFVHEDPEWFDRTKNKHAVFEDESTTQTQGNYEWGLQNKAPLYGPPYPGTEITSPGGAWYEGGAVSRFITNFLGGQGAVGTVHDLWLQALPGWTSIPLMLPAVGLTYVGLINTPMGSALVGGDIVNRDSWP